jgi:hypothetical protein
MHGFYSRSELDNVATQVLGERLDGRPRQGPFVESVTQNYKIGSRLRTPDGITWHYSKCGSNGLAAAMWDRGMASVVVPETLAVIGATPVGSYQVVVNDANVAHGVDYWANGKGEIWASVAPATFQHRTVKSSTASNGTSVILTLYQPLTNALADGDGLEICRSVYAEVDQTNLVVTPEKKSIACVPLKLVTAEYYFWGQTWGACTIAVTGACGTTNNLRQVYFNHADGTIRTADVAGYADGNQPAGYMLPDTAGGAQSIVMLQLDP